jgi:hypothetical protein
MLQIEVPFFTLRPFQKMFQQLHTTTITDRSRWSAVVSFALIAIYLLGAFQNSTVHEFVHSDSTELHSVQNEQDACHQAIYHHANEECGHKLHISSSDKCSLCHLVLHSEQDLPHNFYTSIVERSEAESSPYNSVAPDVDALNLSARAPPIA